MYNSTILFKHILAHLIFRPRFMAFPFDPPVVIIAGEGKTKILKERSVKFTNHLKFRSHKLIG